MGKYVVSLSENGEPLGQMEKLEAHRLGVFHLAFSVIVINDRGEFLLQKRAQGKYHSAGLWSNTCCSHPQHADQIEEYAHQRLMEEMGFDCSLKHCGFFDYKVSFENDLTEHERDHVFLGYYNDDPVPHKDEAEAFRWIRADDLLKDLREFPEKYSFWLPQVVSQALPWVKELS